MKVVVSHWYRGSTCLVPVVHSRRTVGRSKMKDDAVKNFQSNQKIDMRRGGKYLGVNLLMSE